jgi:hypothetical protein
MPQMITNKTDPTNSNADQDEVNTLIKEAKRRIDQPIENDEGSADYIGMKVGPLYEGDPLPYDRAKKVFKDY